MTSRLTNGLIPAEFPISRQSSIARIIAVMSAGSVRYCSTLRVSADRAANRAAHTRGKPRLLDVGRRIPARDRFAPDSPLERAGFEPSVPDDTPWALSRALQNCRQAIPQFNAAGM